MADSGKKVTINDVAKAAGVSKGTVDRVLHDRGEVSRKSREKVLHVVKELGYRPNMYASMLASHKQHVIACIIPEYVEGDFWSLTAKGVRDVTEAVSRYGVTIQMLTYDQYDIRSFREACASVMGMNPSGVILAPMFRKDTLHLASQLTERGIPYVYVDSKIDEDDSYLAYFGMPMYQSGYLCGDILVNGAKVDKVHVIRIERDKTGHSDPTLERREGFMDYMAAHSPETEIVNVFIDPKSPEDINAKLDTVFADDTVSCRHIVMFNSRIHLVAEYMRARGVMNCRTVGFDFLEKNVTAMKEGYVSALIAQHADRQASSAVNALIDDIIHGIHAPKRDNYTQLDIINRYNCEYYM